MADLLNEKKTEQTEKNSQESNIDTSSNRGFDALERLNNAKKLVERANKDAVEKISERERSAKETELENEKRLADTKAKIAENAQYAERLAEERVARMEYSGEYRQRLMARENKKAAEEKKRREEAEKEEARIKAEKRAKEIEEFIRLEKAATAEREKKSGEVISLSLSKPQTELSQSEIKTEKQEEPQVSFEDTQIPEKEIQSITSAESNVNTDDEAEDGKILLVIDPNGAKKDEKEDEENVIHIGQMQYRAPFTPSAHIVNQSYNSTLENEIREAEKKHTELRLAAIARAAGVYSDELRLLKEEELRYHQEIAEIQARRMEYAEHREYMSYASDDFASDYDSSLSSLNDDIANTYDEFSDTRFVSERLSAEEEIAKYERYVSQNQNYIDEEKYFEQPASEAQTLEYGFFDSFAPQPEYAEHIPNASAEYSRPYYDHVSQEALSRYEENLEAKQLADSEDESISHEEFVERHLQNANAFAKTALIKKLSDYRKSEAQLAKKIKRITAKQNTVSHEENIALIVEKIGLRKEITELAVEALTACVYAKAKFKTITYKRVLLSHINAYNAACDEYESHTGKPLAHISEEMADEVIAGIISAPIPNVYYYGNESDSLSPGDSVSLSEEMNHRLEREATVEEAELYRLLSENYHEQFTGDELRERDKRKAEKMSAIRRATERDLLLIGLRQDYQLMRIEAQRDMLANSFSTNKKQRNKKLSALERKIDKMHSETKRALKIERGDNSRFYLLLAMEGEKEKTKKRANKERLNALKMRLEVLLSEREEINERLIALYGGTDKKLTKTKINRKAGGVRKKHARSMYRKQRIIADRIDRIRAPLDMKEKAYALLNKKTACVATIEESYYKLRRLKPEGRAKRELLTDVRRAKAAMKTIDSDVKFLIKKMKRHQMRREEDRRWGQFLVFLVLLAAAGIALWYFFADDVTAYFAELVEKLGKKQ